MAFSIDTSQDEKDQEQQQGGQNAQALPDPSQQASSTSSQASSAAPNAGGSAKSDGTSSATQSSPVKELSSGGSSQAAFGGLNGAGGQGGNAPPSNSSGMFVDLKKYIDANSGQTPASTLADRIGQEGQSAQNALAGAQNQFGQQVAANTINVDQGLLGQAATDASGIVGDQNKYNEIERERTGTYKGPGSLNDVSGFEGGAGAGVTNAIGQFGTEQGQQALLQRYAGRPDYTQGQQALDQYLLANSPESQKYTNQLSQQYGGLGGQYDQALSASNQAAQQAKQTTAATNKAVTDQLTGSATSLEKGVSDQVTQDNAARDAQYAQLLSALKGGNVSASDAAKLGISGGQYRLYGSDLGGYVDPSTYLHQGMTASQNNVASAQQMAQDSALQKLLGGNESFFTDPTQAGKYTDPNASFDAAKFNASVQQADKNYQTALNSTPIPFTTSTTNPNDHTFNSLTGALTALGGNKDWAHTDPTALIKQYSDPNWYTSQGYAPDTNGQYVQLLNALKTAQDKYGYNNVLNVASNNAPGTGNKL